MTKNKNTWALPIMKSSRRLCDLELYGQGSKGQSLGPEYVRV